MLAAADVVVAASHGVAPAPGLLVRALGAGAVPVASHLGSYEEVVTRDDDLGPAVRARRRRHARRPARAADPRRRRCAPACARSAQRARDDFDWARVAQGFEALYDEVGRAPPRRPTGDPAIAGAARRPHADRRRPAHAHRPLERLRDAGRGAARHAPATPGLGAIAVTDHNEISGALDARAKAAEFGVKVIVAEEVKTADQGEVIGLFIEEKIPRGMTLEETIAEIKRQGGLVYVPHPFDRMHSVPDYEHLLAWSRTSTRSRSSTRAWRSAAFNEEAVRFAAKYRIVGGAGSDAHVPQGLGSVRIRMRDFDGPEEFLESLRDADIVRKPQSLLYVQALKFLQTKATPPARAARAARAAPRAARSRATNDAGARRRRRDG